MNTWCSIGIGQNICANATAPDIDDPHHILIGRDLTATSGSDVYAIGKVLDHTGNAKDMECQTYNFGILTSDACDLGLGHVNFGNNTIGGDSDQVTIIGTNNTSCFGIGSIVIGRGSTNCNSDNIAIGNVNQVENGCNVVLGYDICQTSGFHTVSIGSNHHIHSVDRLLLDSSLETDDTAAVKEEDGRRYFLLLSWIR